MRNAVLASILAAAVATAGCLQKDTSSTIYLRPDGSLSWVIIERNVRSDAGEEGARRSEEAEYVDGFSRGDASLVEGLLALGANGVRVRWLRGTRPYAVMVDAEFDALAGVFDRVFAPCGIPYETRITGSGGVTTWTLFADIGLDGASLEAHAGEGCGKGLEGLTDAMDVTIVLESGRFTASTGFVLKGEDTAAVDEETVEEAVRTTGRLELALSWR